MAKDRIVFRLEKGLPLTFTQHDGNINALMYWSGAWEAPAFACGSQYCAADNYVLFSSLVADSPMDFIASQNAVSYQSGVDEWKIPVTVTEYDNGTGDPLQTYNDEFTVTYDGTTWTFTMAPTPNQALPTSWSVNANCDAQTLEETSYYNGTASVNLSLQPCAQVFAGGEYMPNEVVLHEGNLMVANKTTSEEPTLSAVDWDILARSVYGYGSMGLSAPVAGPDITGAFQTLNQFDQIPIPGYGVTFTPASGLVEFAVPGVWALKFGLGMSHNEAQGGRTTYLRIVRVSNSTELARVPLGIGRNVADTNLYLEMWAEIDDTEINQALRIEIGGGDAISAVTYNALNMKVQRVD